MTSLASDGPSKTVIRVRGPSPVIVLVALAFVAAGVLFGRVAVDALTRVELHCDRATGQCEIDASNPIRRSKRVVSIASIRRTRLERTMEQMTTGQRVQHTVSVPMYAVVLETDNGDVRLSDVTTDNADQRRQAQAAIDQFLGDASQPTLAVDYDQNTCAGITVGIIAAICLFIGWSGTTSLRVDVDRGKGRLTVVDVRWPIPPGRRSWPLEKVLRVSQETRITPKRVSATISLELDDGRFDLMSCERAPGAEEERVVQELTEALARR